MKILLFLEIYLRNYIIFLFFYNKMGKSKGNEKIDIIVLLNHKEAVIARGIKWAGSAQLGLGLKGPAI